ncbi:MAG: type I glutamate--ammonia ligase [Planctomycetota bacterium]|jgi:glutamine synthetase
MFDDPKKMLAFIRDAGVEAVDLKFTDLIGSWHHLTLPATSLNDARLSRGVGFDGSSVAGFTAVESGDLVLRPDPSTAFLDPFHEVRTLAVICRVVHADSGRLFSRDPRNVAARAEQHMQKTGIADASIWGPEFEFYVFRKVRVRTHGTSSSVRIKPVQPEACRIPPRHGSGYHLDQPCDRFAALREQICHELEKAGFPVKYHHHEVGALGQCEIELPMGPILRQADACQVVKYFTRMCAHRLGLTVTFMPKPLFGRVGSSMHFHQHLFRGGKPLFHARKGYAGLSPLALQYTAGLLDHGRALTAITNPSTNSFKRLVPGFEAPVNLFFSLANRSAAIRVPKYANTAETKRIEYRPPDGTCNPYLAMAAMLMAGLDGVRKKQDPKKMGFGPFDDDVFKWPEKKRAQIRPLPSSLCEALDALQKDRTFLQRGGVFPADLLDALVAAKRKECVDVNRRPHPLEFELYYNR